MSGYLLAGIGKGLSEAADSVGSAMLQDMRDRSALERAAALEDMREANKLKREEALARLRQEQAAQASKMADEMATSREASAYDKLAASSQAAADQGDVALSREQLQAAVKNDPALGRQYQDMGLIDSKLPLTRNQARLQRAEDEYAASIQLGAQSSVIESFDKKRQRVLEEIREENRDRRSAEAEEGRDRRAAAAEDRRAREFQSLLPVRQQQANAATTSAGAAVTRANRGGDGSSAQDRPATTADLQRQVNNAELRMLEIVGGKKADLFDTISSLEKKAARGDEAAKSTLERLTPARQTWQSASDRLQNFKLPANARSSSAPSSGNNQASRPPLSSFAR